MLNVNIRGSGEEKEINMEGEGRRGRWVNSHLSPFPFFSLIWGKNKTSPYLFSSLPFPSPKITPIKWDLSVWGSKVGGLGQATGDNKNF